MRRRRIADRLLELPWWANLAIAAAVAVAAMYGIPAIMPSGGAWVRAKQELPKLGWIFSFPFLIAAAASAVRHWLERRIREQSSANTRGAVDAGAPSRGSGPPANDG